MGDPQKERIVLAAGCFWGVQKILDNIDGVLTTQCGYVGGGLENPTYRDICTGQTGHAEAVEVQYDTNVVSLSKILSYFWRLHDPTQKNRQGVDVGTQYRSAIFYFDESQRVVAEKSKKDFGESSVFSAPVVTEISKASTFYTAEPEHQKYFDRHREHQVCHVLRSR